MSALRCRRGRRPRRLGLVDAREMTRFTTAALGECGYKITNEQAYPLTNVGVEVSLRCWKMGLGSDTSPLKSCLPSMHTLKTLWKGHTLEPRKLYEINTW
jgi:hypothetical protein